MVYEDIWTTFPDFRLDIIDLVAKDDGSLFVAARAALTLAFRSDQ
jgi:hypothetical protein